MYARLVGFDLPKILVKIKAVFRRIHNDEFQRVFLFNFSSRRYA